VTLPDGFAPTYNVELLCSTEPIISKQSALTSLRKYCPSVAPLDPSPSSDLLAFVHPDHLVHFTDRSLPAQTLITTTEKRPSVSQLESAIQQSWHLPEAKSVVERSRSTVLVTDIMSSPLDHRERLNLFLDVLRGTLDVVPALGIHWVQSQQITDPQAFIKACAERASARFFAGPVNVRFFRVENSSGDMLMDTLGLAALGLPDLQCHFRGLDPRDVSHMLFNLAYYIFENGDVIDDGNTVEGVTPGSKWHCQHEDALAQPTRVVLDVNPGSRFTAGDRQP
jgi:hypothetical protein